MPEDEHKFVPSAEEARPRPQPIGEAELVFGLVYGAGAEVDPVERLLSELLHLYAYTVRSIRLSNVFPAVLGVGFQAERPEATRQLQDMGDQIRRKTDDKSILAQLAVLLITLERASAGAPVGRTAWLVRSLRRPEEVDELRRLYGPRFILLGVHVPETTRREAAQERRQRWSTVSSQRYLAEAAADLQRDEEDPTDAYGQAMRETFSRSDFFIDAGTQARLRETLPRVVELVFGAPFVPPLRDEIAMHHAFTAGTRSTEMGRQVGAAIVTRDGDVLATGTNDVPAGGGGLYWSPDEPDGRDFSRQPAIDSNTLWQRRIARELLVHMHRRGWLAAGRVEQSGEDGVDVTETRLDEFMRAVKGTRFSDITEFGRAVHAEMDALTTAARLGIAVRGCTVVSTTWPCHNCTRHLIAAGIERVVYVFPYAKSLARDLHKEVLSVEPVGDGPVQGRVVFEQFVGVAPRVYAQYFDFGQVKRRNERGGAASAGEPTEELPRVLRSGGTFTFGGPAVPATRIAELERRLAARVRTILETTDDLKIPTEPKETA